MEAITNTTQARARRRHLARQLSRLAQVAGASVWQSIGVAGEMAMLTPMGSTGDERRR